MFLLVVIKLTGVTFEWRLYFILRMGVNTIYGSKYDY